MTVSLLAEKGLISTKPVAKQKATEAILLYVELDKADPVLEELLPLLSHKLPKIVAATLGAFTAIYHEFGCKTVEPKPVLKVLPKVYGHADKNVRAEAQNLTVELYRWLREAMKPLFWSELKPVQQSDLEKLFEKVKDEPAPKPERLLKSQQAVVASAEEDEPAEGDEDGGNEDDEAIDLEPEILAVDVMQKAPKDLEEKLGSSKWKDRKDALDELYTAVNVPAIEEGNFDEIMRGLAKCILKDANIAVVTVAANCVECFAKGLRRSFAKYRSTIMNPIMERLKERKQTVTDALGAALDAVCLATSLSDCMETTLEFLGHKNPLVKLETTRFLARALKSTKEAPGIPEIKPMADAATKLLADSQETQRTAAAEVLGILLKIMGERIMNSYFEGLDDIRTAKIKEFSESAEVKSKYKPKAAAPPPKPAAVAPTGQRKAPLGKKPGTAGSAAPKKAAPPTEEPTPTPLQPKPTARGPLAKPGAAAPGVRGLKTPAAGLAGKRPASVLAPTASPRRAVQSPPLEEAPTPAPKLSRGLTGRNLSKPVALIPDAFPPPSAPTASTTSSADRLELDELRSEVEHLRSANETLRAERNKLTSQIHDLQDQNSQLIEDHTRDVLSIKAKETQLNRARSETEAAEQSASQLQRDVDRMKRELSRMQRSDSPHSHDYLSGGNSGTTTDGVLQDPDRNNANKSYALETPQTSEPVRRRNVVSPAAAGKENNVHGGYGNGKLERNPLLSSRSAGLPRPLSYAASPARSGGLPTPSSRSIPGRLPAQGSSRRVPTPNPNTGDDADASRGGDPVGGAFVDVNRVPGSAVNGGAAGRAGGTAAAAAGGAAASTGQESWRRAAEVTQNLKARIELMKVCISPVLVVLFSSCGFLVVMWRG